MPSIFTGKFISDVPFGDAAGTPCNTGVLHAQSSQGNLACPTTHYWVADAGVLTSAMDHLRSLGCDDVDFTPYRVQANWTSKYGTIAPLHSSPIV